MTVKCHFSVSFRCLSGKEPLSDRNRPLKNWIGPHKKIYSKHYFNPIVKSNLQKQGNKDTKKDGPSYF